MNRDILFKAKREDNSGWVEGGLIPFDVDCGYVYIATPYPYSGTFPVRASVCDRLILVNSRTICQYIGLIDKNSKKIFENDIVKTNRGRLCRVVWFSSPQYQGWDLIPLYDKSPAPHQNNLWSELEVIGSVFDNTESLSRVV